jgi:FkbM family methyltransferase
MSPEHRFLQKLELQGKTVYDIGGFVGLIAMFFARKVGKSGQVVTFEPNPQNYAALLDHLRLNDFRNVTALQIGVSRHPDKLEFFVSNQMPARGTADPKRQELIRKEKGVQAFQIEVDSLDNIVDARKLPFPDLIKIDVEGLELGVLEGMTRLLQEHKPDLHVELHGPHDAQVAAFLLEKGYSLLQIEENLAITPENFQQAHGHLFAFQSPEDPH